LKTSWAGILGVTIVMVAGCSAEEGSVTEEANIEKETVETSVERTVEETVPKQEEEETAVVVVEEPPPDLELDAQASGPPRTKDGHILDGAAIPKSVPDSKGKSSEWIQDQIDRAHADGLVPTEPKPRESWRDHDLTKTPSDCLPSCQGAAIAEGKVPGVPSNPGLEQMREEMLQQQAAQRAAKGTS
jgi:hypothetical protein